MKSRDFILIVVTFATSIVVVSCQICRPFNKTSLNQACGYNYTAKFLHEQHYHGARRAVEIFTSRNQGNYYKLYECSPYADLMICSLFLPKCVEGIRKPLLPCREVCEEFIKGCEDRLMELSLEWIVGMCGVLPKLSNISKDKTDGECFLPPKFKRTTTDYTSIRCYPMTIPSCKGLGYKYTILTPKTQKKYTNHMTATITSYAQKNHTNPKCVEKMRKLICAETVPPCFSGAMHYNCREECENIHDNCSKHFWYGADMCIEFPKGNTPQGYCKQADWPRSANWPDFMSTTQPPSSAVSKLKEKFSDTAKHFTKIISLSPTAGNRHPSHGVIHNLSGGKGNGAKGPLAAVASTKSPTSPGTIAGVVIAVVLIVLIILVAGFFLYKRYAYRTVRYKKQVRYEYDGDTANFEI